jgi:hypothetical protein
LPHADRTSLNGIMCRWPSGALLIAIDLGIGNEIPPENDVRMEYNWNELVGKDLDERSKRNR